MPRALALALATLALPLFVAGAQKAYIAPSSTTVTARLEVMQGTRAGHEIWVTNGSTVALTVTAVALTSCVNIRQSCDTHRVNVKIPASSRRRVFRIERDVSSQSHTFRWTYAWTADSTSTAALTALAQGGSKDASDRLAAMQHADEVRRREVGYADIPLTTADVARLGDVIRSLRAEPDSFVVAKDSVLYMSQLRILALDSLGQSLGRYRAGMSFRLEPGTIRFAAPDSIVAVSPGRSAIIIAPSAAVNAGRQTPLAPVRFTIIVP